MENAPSTSTKGIWHWNIFRLTVGLSLLYFILLFTFGSFDEASTRQAIRISARIAAVLFCMAFGASAFHRWMKNSFSFWLLMNRKYFGISFAVVHLIHLCFLLILQQYFHPVFNLAKTSSLLGGGLAYFFVVLMLLTSFPAFSKHLSRQHWKALHTVGSYWIWIIFFRSYLKRALTEYEYVPLVVVLVFVLGLRLLFLKGKMGGSFRSA
ncbi:MAG: hypothetical protein H6577_07730 [Lewinellaceae bacterium]|nr:hypothetical protein [Saprospiraceae bacterium]MCB9338003.1 hypothetical protein [Lewinellaceae bacterium]